MIFKGSTLHGSARQLRRRARDVLADIEASLIALDSRLEAQLLLFADCRHAERGWSIWSS
jgi:hypothetical protein